MPASRRARGIGYSVLSLAVFLTAVWRWYALRKRLLQSDGAMDLAREAAASATAAVDKAVDEMAEAQAHTSAAERELAACRLAIAEVQQALQRVEQEHKKEKRAMALQRVRNAAAIAAASATARSNKGRAVKPGARAADAGAGEGAESPAAAADIGDGVRLALRNFEQGRRDGEAAALGTDAPDQLARHADGRVDMRNRACQQAFIKSLQTALQSSEGEATAAAAHAAAPPYTASVSSIDFSETGELSRVGLDLKFAGGGAPPESGRPGPGVRDVE